jgi:hypothetical protein
VFPRAAVRARPYAQMLAGVVVASCCGEYEARFVVEPGGGLDIPVSRRAALRFGVGLPMTFGDDRTEMLRAHAGVSFDIGRR